jgi:hypothetical protein
MSFHSWVENLKSTCGLGSGRRTLSRSQRRQPVARRRLQVEALEDRCMPSTFTVLNINDSGVGSFRDAIVQVNADTQPGTDTIVFAIRSGVQTIVPLSALPNITHPVVIDGTTQPGFAGKPLIELNGVNAGTAASGLTIDAGGSTVKDLVINRFATRSGTAIVLENQGGDTLAGNYLGTDVTGTQALGGGGVFITSFANTIGGTATGAGNLILLSAARLYRGSNLISAGVAMLNSGQNLVQGNFIGTDVTGTQQLDFGSNGIYIEGGFGSNIIGGTTAGARNLISGHTWNINITHGVVTTDNTGNLVEGNYIGTDVTGTKALKNGVGVALNSNSNTIGGTTAGARNLISGCGSWGVGIYTGPSGNLVEGNYIGTDVTGTHALGNGVGVSMGNPTSGPSTIIGGTAPGAGNLISGNVRGIRIADSTSHLGFNGALVQGNYIGTDVTGTRALSNSNWGVVLDNTNFATIGGTSPGAGNIIAFNKAGGVVVAGNTIGNAIQHNSIFSNRYLGILAIGSGPVLTSAVSSKGNLTIGGTLTGAANTTYTLEFFSNPDATSGGKTYLGSITVTTDATGKAIFKAGFAVTVAPGQFITATATDPFSTTSMFSNSELVA